MKLRVVTLIWENAAGERHAENFGLADPYPQEEHPATLSADEIYFRSRTDWVLKEITSPDTAIIEP